MDKKEYLLTLLTHLESKWNLAKGLKYLIEQGHLDDNILQIVIESIESAINTTEGDQDLVKLKKMLKKS